MILLRTTQSTANPNADHVWKSTDKVATVSTTNVHATEMEKSDSETPLGSLFKPGHFDVICARGKDAWNHPGNIHFRSLVQKAVERYERTTSRCHRTAIVTEIITEIRRKGNGFVKQESNGEWYEVGNILAREKVGQMIRNNALSIA